MINDTNMTKRIMEPSSTPKPVVNQIWKRAKASANPFATGFIPSRVNANDMVIPFFTQAVRPVQNVQPLMKPRTIMLKGKQ